MLERKVQAKGGRMGQLIAFSNWILVNHSVHTPGFLLWEKECVLSEPPLLPPSGFPLNFVPLVGAILWEKLTFRLHSIA